MQSPEPADREEILDRLCTEYLEAEEANRAPERDAWLAEHPEFREDLAEFLDCRDQVAPRFEPWRSLSSDQQMQTVDFPPDDRAGHGDTQLPPGYESLGILGAGGMGVVYRARDRKLGREVAIKALRDDYASDPSWLARFEREARLLASLNHSNIATLFGLEENDGQRFLVMELVPGESLADRLTRGALTLAESLPICRQIAEALETAHDQGIIHRDLKPANIIITPEGKVKILDFGLAKSTIANGTTNSQQHLTGEGAVAGTWPYMSPEQARGKPLDKRCDVWAFGCVLYEVLTGRRAFMGETASDIVAAIIEREPNWLALPKDLPPRIEKLLRRCLDRDSKRRLRDLGDARLEIDDTLAGNNSDASPPADRWRQLALGSTAILIGLCLALGLWLQWRPPRDPPAVTPSPVVVVPSGWSGEFLLGGATRAFGPRLSPDQKWLAYCVIQDGQAQVGVIKLDEGKPRVLTQAAGGTVNGLCWSPDGNFIYYDLFFDSPMGVYKVKLSDSLNKPQGSVAPEIAGVECPQVIDAASLLVCRIQEGGTYQMQRWWPHRAGEPQDLGPCIEFKIGWPPPVRVLPHSKKVVFCGKIRDGADAHAKRHFYLLDLDQPTSLTRISDLEITSDYVPIAVSRDERFVYTIVPADDLFQLIRMPIEGASLPVKMVPVMTRAYGLDVDEAERIYIDQFDRPLDVLSLSPDDGKFEKIASLSRGRDPGFGLQPVQLPDGGVLIPSTVAGKERLLVARQGQEPVPLLPDEPTETAQPAILLNPNQAKEHPRLVFVEGSGVNRQLAIREWRNDRWWRTKIELNVPIDGLKGLAASPTGATLYYIQDKKVWSIATAEGKHEPINVKDRQGRSLMADGIAVHPKSGELLIQQFEKDGVKLRWGPEFEVITIKSEANLRLAPFMIGSRSINEKGQVLVTTTSKDSWFWRVGILDLNTHELLPLNFKNFAGDSYPANWGSDGRILTIDYPLRSDLWRLSPVK